MDSDSFPWLIVTPTPVAIIVCVWCGIGDTRDSSSSYPTDRRVVLCYQLKEGGKKRSCCDVLLWSFPVLHHHRDAPFRLPLSPPSLSPPKAGYSIVLRNRSIDLFSSINNTFSEMACLKRLREDIAQLESLFPKNHPRVQVRLSIFLVLLGLPGCLSRSFTHWRRLIPRTRLLVSLSLGRRRCRVLPSNLLWPIARVFLLCVSAPSLETLPSLTTLALLP